MPFQSLQLALEKRFEKPFAKLPKNIQSRVEKEFPLSWDNLTVSQRRQYAEQWDYQHDPAMESDRQHWWDFYQRMQVIEHQIEHWTTIATPTATDLAAQESRLKELRLELETMKQKEKLATFLAKSAVKNKVSEPETTVEYFAYPKAMKYLSDKYQATPEEVAAWLFIGPQHGGLAAYTNVNELFPPPRFYFGNYSLAGSEDYIAPLMTCHFIAEDIKNFNPTDRYITGEALIKRWSNQTENRASAFIHAKIAESRLNDLHPIYGGTSATFSDFDNFPLLDTGLFAMSQILEIEATDFDSDASKLGTNNNLILGSPEWRKNNAKNAADAKHDLPGGSRDKQKQIREIWATGKYNSRDVCAEEECAALDMSFAAARNALKNMPLPVLKM